MFRRALKPVRRQTGGFTLVEVVAAMMLLAILLSSVLVLMNRYTGAVIDMHLRQQAFELARANMEQLLSEPKLSDVSEYGTSDANPDLEWETLVEPFYEPVTERMWIRAVCSASFLDSKGEPQDVELEHWMTNLTAAQVKQILAQRKVEDAYMELLQDNQASEVQETTRAYLQQEGLDVEAYDKLLTQQRRKKLEYIAQNGFDGYEQYLTQLEEEENLLLEKLGMNFDGYNEFARTYVPAGGSGESTVPDGDDTLSGADEGGGDLTDTPAPPADAPSDQPASDIADFDWSNVPPELVPVIEQLLGTKKK